MGMLLVFIIGGIEGCKMQKWPNLVKFVLLLFCVNFGSQTVASITYENLQVETNDGRSSGRSFTGIWLNYNNVDLYHKSPDQISRISFEFGSDYEKEFY